MQIKSCCGLLAILASPILVAENDYSEILLACMRDLLEHDNARRALDLARAMAEVIRQQQEFVRLVQKLLGPGRE